MYYELLLSFQFEVSYRIYQTFVTIGIYVERNNP